MDKELRNPIEGKGTRETGCNFYGVCWNQAIINEWPSFHCDECPHKEKKEMVENQSTSSTYRVKVCDNCGEEKPITEFRHRTGDKNPSKNCIRCINEAVSKSRKKKPGPRPKYTRKAGKKPEQKNIKTLKGSDPDVQIPGDVKQTITVTIQVDYELIIEEVMKRLAKRFAGE